MEITEVRVKLVGGRSERLRAFCSITLDGDFVVRDLKVIDGVNGAFVAMPSRKLADRCRNCGCKNHLRAKHCNECGQKLPDNRAPKQDQGRAKLHADVAHPINSPCRERIQTAVVEAYETELERSKEPGYKPVDYDDYEDYEDEGEGEGGEPETAWDSAKSGRDEADDDGEDEREGAGPTSTGDSEYDSLIADLKRDAASRRVARTSAESTVPVDEVDEPVERQADTESSREPADRTRRDRGPRRDDRRGRDEGRGPARVESPPAPASSDDDRAVAEAEPEPAPETRTEKEPDTSSDFGAGIL